MTHSDSLEKDSLDIELEEVHQDEIYREDLDEEEGEEEEGSLESTEYYQHNMRLKTRILFSLGAMGRVDTSMQNYFLQPFLLETAKVSPAYVGTIMVARKLWDATTDPIIGRWSDMIETPMGRRKPWVFLSCIPLCIYWLLQWMLQPVGQIASFFYYMVVLVVYSSLHTLQVVPYRALIPDVALTYNTRSSVATWMQGLGQISAVAAVSITGLIIQNYPTDGYLYAALLLLPFVSIPRLIAVLNVKERNSRAKLKVKGSEAEDEGEKNRARGKEKEKEKEEEKEGGGRRRKRVSIDGGAENLLEEGGVCLERATSLSPPPPVSPPSELSFWENLQERAYFWLVQEKDFTLVVLTCFLISVAGAMITGNFLFYLKYIFSISSLATPLLLQTSSSLISLPFWFLIMKRIGKNRTFLASGSLIAFLMSILAVLPAGSSPYIIYVFLFFFGLFNSVALIVQAMIPDSVVAYERSTGRRDEAFLFSISLLAAKIGQAVGLSTSSFILGAVGYNAHLSVQPAEVVFALRILTFGAPAVMILICCGLILCVTDFSATQNTPSVGSSSSPLAPLPPLRSPSNAPSGALSSPPSPPAPPLSSSPPSPSGPPLSRSD